MNQALVQIVLMAIKEQFVSEKAFYHDQLGITPQSWDRWKKGEQGLKTENMQKISLLFTDYEWMMVQKVCRNALFLPEVAANPVSEFQHMKFHVAKKWANSGIAELEFKRDDSSDDEEAMRKPAVTTLKISVNYDFWSYRDMIELRLPGVIQQQIEREKQDLLEWFNENIDEKFPTAY
ncbi:hypothetical protein ACWOFR_12335 [Carnobacterium gallinarum]|uniref:hypothetical protein n=1 Tax=Carnobacterium gallinarum TaxID=2749 RepID=UPI00054E2774|nr:hypothetical protein [Carnobacterium gallinarum]